MRWNMHHTALTILNLAAVFGCGSPADSIAKPAAPATPPQAELPAVVPTNPEPVAERKEVSTEPVDPIPTIAVDEPALVKPIKMDAPAPEPSTSAATTRLIDLQKFPRIKAKGVLDQGPTYIYYFGEASVKSADAFYQSELKTAGWIENPSNIPASEQYFDRLYSKSGSYVRATVSEGSKAGEVGVSLSSLGNVDVRLLPKMDDAVPVDSTPVNAGHQSDKSGIQKCRYCCRGTGTKRQYADGKK